MRSDSSRLVSLAWKVNGSFHAFRCLACRCYVYIIPVLLSRNTHVRIFEHPSHLVMGIEIQGFWFQAENTIWWRYNYLWCKALSKSYLLTVDIWIFIVPSGFKKFVGLSLHEWICSPLPPAPFYKFFLLKFLLYNFSCLSQKVLSILELFETKQAL